MYNFNQKIYTEADGLFYKPWVVGIQLCTSKLLMNEKTIGL